MTWEGKERRNMNEDSLQRDRLLTRLDANVEFLVDSQKNMTQALVDHAHVDDKRFGQIDDTLRNMSIKNARFYGVIYGGSAVIGAVSAVIMKVIFK